MPLVLTIRDLDTLDNGEPATLTLDRHGAVIGRSLHADWSLPDPSNRISSRHCEVRYRDGAYLLIDQSTNGTYVNGATERLDGAHPLAEGDCFAVGHFEIVVSDGEAAPPAAAVPATPQGGDWDAWQSGPASAREEEDGWAPPPERVAGDSVWRQTPPPPPAPTGASAWDMPAPVASPSPWSSAPPRADTPSATDVWGKLAEDNEIDWSRGDFAGVSAAAEGWAPAPPPPAAAAPAQDWEDAPEAPTAAPSTSPSAPVDGEDWARFVVASGLPADRLRRSPGDTLAASGAILRQLVSGLMLMIDARARAKAQLGAQATGLELDGNNPLKFVRSPERALLQLLDLPEPGFMPAERAVEDAYHDLQAHQMATLSAMHGALQGTLARFSPAAVRDRVGAPRGWRQRFSVLHRAAQWDAYEREFEGVVRGADEAFMDLFAKEFRLSYDRHIAEMKARRNSE
jgi:type VI secretion system protein ImpI/type VI secretion system protein